MEIVSASSPAWGNQAHTSITLKLVLNGYGEVSFGASPEDLEPHGRELFERAALGEFGPIAEYVPPAVPVAVPQEISKAQGIATLMEHGYWPAVNTYFTTQASPETLTLFSAVTVFNRTSPLLLQMQALLGISDAEVDQMFISGATKVI